MVGAEFGRTIQYFRTFRELWTRVSAHIPIEINASTTVAAATRIGRRAYSLKMADWNESRATGVLGKFKDTAQQCRILQEWASFDWGKMLFKHWVDSLTTD